MDGATSAGPVSVDVFSTCPLSPRDSGGGAAFFDEVARVARWSEEAGCRGILVYTDNERLDPWLTSQVIIQSTRQLCPLVAVQPVYMHPFSVAKMVNTLAHLYGRRVYLNMVAGGFANDLVALNDPTPHDRRYDRMIEYTRIIQRLLSESAGVTCEGEFYKVSQLRLSPPMPPELVPGVFVSGSSPAGLAAARALGAIAVEYPEPSGTGINGARRACAGSGARVGIIARPTGAEAWEVAHARFPEDRKGQLTHQLAMKTSDSAWHDQLSRLGERDGEEASPYWLVPFKNYKTFCPYLVGSHARVADELASYIRAGHRQFILDIPPSEEELRHIGTTFDLATRQVNPCADHSTHC